MNTQPVWPTMELTVRDELLERLVYNTDHSTLLAIFKTGVILLHEEVSADEIKDLLSDDYPATWYHRVLSQAHPGTVILSRHPPSA